MFARALCTIIFLFCLAGAGQGQELQFPVERELWFVSTRCLPENPCECRRQEWNLDYYQDINCRLHKLSPQEFRRLEQPHIPTVILVPGSPADFETIVTLGRKAYRILTRSAPYQSVRFVVWAWPSDRIEGVNIVRHFREISPIAEAQGVYLAHFLNDHAAHVPVSLSGYSFGTKLALSALHQIGGGTLPCCDQFIAPQQRSQKLNLVLLAAAAEECWLYAGGRYNRALDVPCSILLTRNERDPILTKYHLLYGVFADQQAIGATGILRPNCLGPAAQRITQANVTAIIGKSHDPEDYLDSPEIIALLLPYLTCQVNR